MYHNTESIHTHRMAALFGSIVSKRRNGFTYEHTMSGGPYRFVRMIFIEASHKVSVLFVAHNDNSVGVEGTWTQGDTKDDYVVEWANARMRLKVHGVACTVEVLESQPGTCLHTYGALFKSAWSMVEAIVMTIANLCAIKYGVRIDPAFLTCHVLALTQENLKETIAMLKNSCTKMLKVDGAEYEMWLGAFFNVDYDSLVFNVVGSSALCGGAIVAYTEADGTVMYALARDVRNGANGPVICETTSGSDAAYVAVSSANYVEHVALNHVVLCTDSEEEAFMDTDFYASLL